VLVNNGAGAFAAKVDFDVTGDGTLAAADATGDGKPDLFVDGGAKHGKYIESAGRGAKGIAVLARRERSSVATREALPSPSPSANHAAAICPLRTTRGTGAASPLTSEEVAMSRSVRELISASALALLSVGCSRSSDKAGLPPEPVVNHTSADAVAGQKIEHGELILPVDEARKRLHQQHHSHAVLETRRVPGSLERTRMTDVDFGLSKGDLDVVNPGPGEFVHVMEGQRHGMQNLTIGITYTAPGGAPPMHTHVGEESHVLVKGQKVLYALGDKLFVQEGPYIVNIPPMTPHSFQNLDDEVAELVVIFPTNVWEYDVLDQFPFVTPRAKALADDARRHKARP
jgi:quercetin dioxygenase-like cupin family protein